VVSVVLIIATLGWVAAIIGVHRAAEGNGGSHDAGAGRRVIRSTEGHAARRLLAGRIDSAAYRELMAGLARRDGRAPRLGSGPRSKT
jgi:hypothetical protein